MVYKFIGKVICVPELPCCHVTYRSFLFRVLICFCFTSNAWILGDFLGDFLGDIASLILSVQCKDQCLDGQRRAEKFWYVNDERDWKGNQHQYHMLSEKEVIAKSYNLKHQKILLLYLNINITPPCIGRLVNLQDKGKSERTQNDSVAQSQNTVWPNYFLGDWKHRGRRVSGMFAWRIKE